MKLPTKPLKPVILPTPLPFKASPNYSDRQGAKPYLIVLHRPVGKYGPSINWLCNPKAQASAHWISEGNNTGVDVATQLVEWHKKSWGAAAFNPICYNLEVDDDAWDGDDLTAAFTAARMVAFICWKTGIPPVWSQNPLHNPGIIRHLDLGKAGGGHSDPTSDILLWKWFIKQCVREHDRGDFRKTYGKGRFVKI